MLTAAVNKHYVLECRRGPHVHYIPIPRPSRLGTDASLQAITTAWKKATVACPVCGFVSVYSESDVQVQMSPKPDPFEADARRLVYLEVECDGRNCRVPKTVHTIMGNDKGIWKQKVAPKDWEFDFHCVCDKGHLLAPRWEGDLRGQVQRKPLF
jgi:hypothetical protein